MFDYAKVRKLREESGLTTYQVAEELSLSQGYIHQIEKNMKIPNANIVEAIANFFKIPIQDLFKDDLGDMA